MSSSETSSNKTNEIEGEIFDSAYSEEPQSDTMSEYSTSSESDFQVVQSEKRSDRNRPQNLTQTHLSIQVFFNFSTLIYLIFSYIHDTFILLYDRIYQD